MTSMAQRDRLSVEKDARPRKRAKRGSSCLACRGRKVKCDGTRPICSRCKSYQALCTYEQSGAGSDEKDAADGDESPALGVDEQPSSDAQNATAATGAPSMDLSRSHLQDYNTAACRIDDAERHTEVQPGSSSTPLLRAGPQYDIFPMCGLRGSGWATQYWGFTHPTSLVSDFGKLLSYNRDLLTRHPSLMRATNEVRERHKQFKAFTRGHTASAADNAASLLSQCISSRAKTDDLIRLYMATFNNVYHVVHGPDFWTAYETMWQKPLAQADGGVLAIVVSMKAAVVCIPADDTAKYVGEDVVSRALATKWLEAVALWASDQSQKHRNFAQFQVRCISLIAAFVIGMKLKRWWQDSGSLLRFATCAGLHLEPSDARMGNKTSTFECEMRRRIWSTIAELECKASIHRGAIPDGGGRGSDCGSPVNVNDDVLSETTDRSLVSQPSSVFTPASALVIGHESRDLRREVIQLLNTPAGDALQQSQVMELEHRLLSSLSSVPRWADHQGDATGCDSQARALARAIIRSQLLELLMLLHRRASESAKTPGFRDYTRHGRFNAAAGIIEQHRQVKEQNSLIIALFMGDAFTAALNICYDLCTLYPEADAFFVPSRINPIDICDYIESALDAMERRTKQAGAVLRRYWLLAVGLSLGRTIADPANAAKHEKRIVDRLSSIIYMQLSLQADYSALGPMFHGANTGQALTDGVHTQSVMPTQPAMSPVHSFDDMPPLGSTDFNDFATWNIDAFFDI